jgi:YVTN family beta-propeller protein
MPVRLLGALVLVILLAPHHDARAEVRVFVTNEKSNGVTVIDAVPRSVVKTIALGQRPRGVAVSPDGRRVYVANSNSDSVSVIDTRDLTVITTAPAGLDPEGLTINKAGLTFP